MADQTELLEALALNRLERLTGAGRRTPFGTLRQLAPGVLGCIEDKGDCLVVIWLEAEEEGSGDVGRWLDRLDPATAVIVMEVLSERLRGMLTRRGFTPVEDTKHLTRIPPGRLEWMG